MRCNFFIASQLSLVDLQSKLVTAINILEDFQSVTFPTAIQTSVIFVVHKEEGEPTQNSVLLNVTLGDNALINNYAIQINFQEAARGIKSVTSFNGLIIANPGELKFTLSNANTGTVLGTYSIMIVPATAIGITTNTATAHPTQDTPQEV